MTTTAGAYKQPRLSKCGGRRADRHPRAHLFTTMALLAAREDTCLTALEDTEWVDDGEYTAREIDLDRIVDQATTFYALVIGPVYRSWWLH